MLASKPPRPNWPAQPHLAVFLRNLHLLHLHLHDDWPAISLRSLSPASQNQRQRLKAIEWALYHLVALWDPDTARDKLRPFFPPLEPLQSVNLRAALFRVLSDLKKNGDLGRETILRKSMLDDCKGDKFDELLAVFSTAVLRRRLAETFGDSLDLRSPAIKLALADGLTREEYQRLLPLILAHRVSLKNHGERRSRVRSTHEQFVQLLDKKQAQLDARANEKPAPLPTDKTLDPDALAHEVKANWLGSAEWANTLLDGGAHGTSDAFLDLPFDAAWSRATASTVDDLTSGSGSTPDLLVDLESRVTRQRARVQRWHQYSHSMQRHSRVQSAAPSPPSLVFREHQALTVASISKAVREPVQRVAMKAEDRALIFSLNEALARINGRAPPSRGPHADAHVSKYKSQQEQESRLETHAEEHDFSPVPVTQDFAYQPPSPSPGPVPIPEEREDEEEDEDHPTHSVSISPSVHISRSPDPDPYEHELPKRSLVDRTRKSMSFLPPPSNTSASHLHHHHHAPHPRKSKPRASFPANQFETPQKQKQKQKQRGGDPYSHSRASTPRDELFEDEADYASVFKSRPRVAHSPVSSPAVHVSPVPSPVEDLDLEVESPSAGRGGYR